jgi:hypothetical protein
MYKTSPSVLTLFQNPLLKYHGRTMWWQRVKEHVEFSVILPRLHSSNPDPLKGASVDTVPFEEPDVYCENREVIIINRGIGESAQIQNWG